MATDAKMQQQEAGKSALNGTNGEVEQTTNAAQNEVATTDNAGEEKNDIKEVVKIVHPKELLLESEYPPRHVKGISFGLPSAIDVMKLGHIQVGRSGSTCFIVRSLINGYFRLSIENSMRDQL